MLGIFQLMGLLQFVVGGCSIDVKDLVENRFRSKYGFSMGFPGIPENVTVRTGLKLKSLPNGVTVGTLRSKLRCDPDWILFSGDFGGELCACRVIASSSWQLA